MKKLGMFFLIVFVFLGCSKKEEKLETTNQGTVIFILGKVEFSKDGEKWEKTILNQKIEEGDWIKTQEKSQAKIQLWNSSTLLIQANTTTKIETLNSQQQFLLHLEKGSVRCLVEKIIQEKGFYEVKGLAMAAGVRGTEFDFANDGVKETLSVHKGRVAVKRNIQGSPEKLVEAGQEVTLFVKENNELKNKLEGKSDKEKEKLLEIPLKNSTNLETEMPQDMKEMLSNQDKMIQEESKKQEQFVEEKAKEVKQLQKTQEKKIDAMTEKKGKEIDKMVEGDDDFANMDSLLKKAKDKKKN